MKKDLIISKQHLIFLLFFVAVFCLVVTTRYFYSKQERSLEKDIYMEFLSEVYDKIKENYWENLTDEQLTNLFELGTEKLLESEQTLNSNDKEGLKAMFLKELKNMDEAQKKEFSVNLANIVLNNLKPFGRSALYTEKEEKILRERVKNVNPETGQVEPTIISKLVRPDVFYIQIKKISPQTFDEFKNATDEVDNRQGLDSLILDLRDNVGGSIDILPYFLGPFIGKNQYAYEFFRKGEYIPFKTQIGWLPSLVRYKKVVILINKQTQSSAEVMAAVLKKFNVGIVIGEPTRGWGTIENTFEIKQQIAPDEKFRIFIVHSLTLREDGQPIEGRGVEPLININDSDWQEQLFAYFHYPELIKSVKEILDL